MQAGRKFIFQGQLSKKPSSGTFALIGLELGAALTIEWALARCRKVWSDDGAVVLPVQRRADLRPGKEKGLRVQGLRQPLPRQVQPMR